MMRDLSSWILILLPVLPQDEGWPGVFGLISRPPQPDNHPSRRKRKSRKRVSCKQRGLSPTHCLGDLSYVRIHFDGVPQVSERWRNEKRGRWRVAPWSRNNELRIQGIADVCEVLLQERYQGNRIIRRYLKPELWSVVPLGCLSPRS